MAQTIALVIGSSGGIGAALLRHLKAGGRHDAVIGFSRSGSPGLDLLDEDSIRHCADWAARQGGEIRLILDATGALALETARPEKSLKEISADALAQSYAINAIGPALLMKHFLPLLPRTGRSVFATLSARVGSIGDNRAGGWYAYRASKAALNQLVRTASVELRRTRPDAVCAALHPGTVRTPLTQAFAKTGLEVQEPEQAAARLVAVAEALTPEQSGCFFDHLGKTVPW